MSARDKMISVMRLSPLLAEKVADEILNEHAHELAAKIRDSEELRDLTDDHMSDCDAAADLIDPEA